MLRNAEEGPGHGIACGVIACPEENAELGQQELVCQELAGAGVLDAHQLGSNAGVILSWDASSPHLHPANMMQSSAPVQAQICTRDCCTKLDMHLLQRCSALTSAALLSYFPQAASMHHSEQAQLCRTQLNSAVTCILWCF